MLAIYTEATTAANQQGRDLWQEAMDLKYDLYAFSPEMLIQDHFNKWVTSAKVAKNLAFFFVDEAHMILTWGKTFCLAYERLPAMQARLRSTVTWSAMSASVSEPGGWREIQNILGFSPNQFHDEKRPTDHRDLFYSVQFLKHSMESLIFPDLAWCLPEMEEEAGHLTPTIFSVISIKKAIRLRNFLQHEILLIRGSDHPSYNTDMPVTDFHALHSMADRRRKLEHVAEGQTLFFVCMLAANVGINTKRIKRIIMVDAPSSFEEGTQWAGRASHNGEGGEAILCIRDEMREESHSELHGDQGWRMKKLTDKQLKKWEEI
jgi:superfamily II DNA helicase RecQ